ERFGGFLHGLRRPKCLPSDRLDHAQDVLDAMVELADQHLPHPVVLLLLLPAEGQFVHEGVDGAADCLKGPVAAHAGTGRLVASAPGIDGSNELACGPADQRMACPPDDEEWSYDRKRNNSQAEA